MATMDVMWLCNSQLHCKSRHRLSDRFIFLFLFANPPGRQSWHESATCAAVLPVYSLWAQIAVSSKRILESIAVHARLAYFEFFDRFRTISLVHVQRLYGGFWYGFMVETETSPYNELIDPHPYYVGYPVFFYPDSGTFSKPTYRAPPWKLHCPNKPWIWYEKKHQWMINYVSSLKTLHTVPAPGSFSSSCLRYWYHFLTHPGWILCVV